MQIFIKFQKHQQLRPGKNKKGNVFFTKALTKTLLKTASLITLIVLEY